MKTLIIVIFVFLSLLIDTSQTNKEVTQKELHEQVIKRVSKTEFAEYIKSNTNFQLIDVRTPGEYDSGKIENAVNINFMDKEFESNIQKLDKEIPTLIYCQSGGRSAKALKKMNELGFRFVFELEGGFGNWKYIFKSTLSNICYSKVFD